MLEAVAQQGSIWPQRARWACRTDTCGGPQAVGRATGWRTHHLGKGQSAQLSEFGTKLLWAERQAQARLAPQIAALHADLERASRWRLTTVPMC
jgi:hypothetical protein